MAFQFLHRWISSLEDATVNFEQLESLFSQPGAQLPFLQLLSAQKLLIQTGEVTGLAVAVGFNNVAVTLATPWPGQHIAFLPFINGSGNLGALSYVGANQTSLSQGGILLNSTAATTINVGYVSLGN